MEIFIFIILVVFVYLNYASVKPSEPLLRKDIEPVDESIPLSQGKKILREFLKTNPKPFLSRFGLNANSPKREINEAIRNEVESFTDNFKDDIELCKQEIYELLWFLDGSTDNNELKEMCDIYDDIDYAEEEAKIKSEIEELKAKLKRKDCSNLLLWCMNDLNGLDRKTNEELSRKNYIQDDFTI